MISKISVIGIGGVGMAHVCAISRLGLKVDGLFDINPTILENAKSEWRNEWDWVLETEPAQQDVMYSTDYQDAAKLQSDLTIIATPPNSHKEITEYLLENTSSKILVEKPLSNIIWNQPNIDTRLYVSSEWIYHSQLPNSIEREIEMAFPSSKTTIWDCDNPAYLDFYPHLLSIIFKMGYSVEKVEEIVKRQDFFLFEIHLCRDFKKTTIYAKGIRTKSHEIELGLFIDNVKFDWEMDLFDKQIDSILKGTESLWTKILPLENLVKEF